MTTSWLETLKHIRAQAARNCGLDTYPAKLIAKTEDDYRLRADRALWRNYLAERDKTRKQAS